MKSGLDSMPDPTGEAPCTKPARRAAPLIARIWLKSLERNPMSAPIGFTSQKRERFLALLEQGFDVTAAADKAGTTPQTVHKWVRAGRKEETGDKREFADRFDAIRNPVIPIGPLDHDDLIRLLEAQARQGRIEAMKLLLTKPWEKVEKPQKEEPAPVLSIMKKLEAKRAQ